MTTSSQSSQGGYTKIEQSIRAALLQRGDQFNQITKSAWYFVVSFDDVRAGVPYGRLMHYEKNDWPFAPSIFVDIPGEIVGDVRVANGRAYFAGAGYVKFSITKQAADLIWPPKVEVPLADPKPLLMICRGQVESAASTSTSTQGNPVLYYQCGTSKFGLYVPDGTARVQINSTTLGRSAAVASADRGRDDSVIWLTYVDDQYAQKTGGPRYRLLNDVVNPDDVLNHVLRQEFFFDEPFSVGLTADSVFTIGGSPSPDAAFFRGWIDEVVFDPSGGSESGRP